MRLLNSRGKYFWSQHLAPASPMPKHRQDWGKAPFHLRHLYIYTCNKICQQTIFLHGILDIDKNLLSQHKTPGVRPEESALEAKWQGDWSFAGLKTRSEAITWDLRHFNIRLVSFASISRNTIPLFSRSCDLSTLQSSRKTDSLRSWRLVSALIWSVGKTHILFQQRTNEWLRCLKTHPLTTW